ncbi:LamG domain-containing protein [Pseudaquabacterium pictum]|uniref:DUF6701 domain-containing protein n=1 Tax=Pseudaquabacterium pictum TaxID=2315236 RepID=A0A480AMH8_9BURK|nr:LamG domain-containing protein [Rubrivivax pictus]GCL62216.1 hypothetical protein AQPW35_12970 [Rubrivivax pictus]
MRAVCPTPPAAAPTAWLRHACSGLHSTPALRLWRHTLACACLLLLLWPLALRAQSVTYTFPGSLPPGCSGSGPNYSCAAGALPNNTAVVINSPRPATITINGNVDVGQGTVINAAGSASDLTLVVNGTLTLRMNSRITATIQARTVTDAEGYATVTGNITSTVGAVTVGQFGSVSGSISSASTLTLGNYVNVGGNLSAASTITLNQEATVGGNVYNADNNLEMAFRSRIRGSADIDFTVNMAQESRIDGNLSSRDDDINLGYAAIVGGTVYAQESITLAQNAAAGALLSDIGDISIGYAAQVTGDITTTNGTVDFLQDSVAGGCVRSVDTDRITLGTNARIGAVCCGTATNGSCSRSCVSNSSGRTLPAACTSAASVPTPIASWLFNEAGWGGGAGEVRDSSGSFHAQAAGLSSTTASVADATPALGTSTGTCGYGVFNRSNLQHVLLPASFGNLGASASFTLTAWFRTTDNTQPNQRIFADDENGHATSNNGFILSLGDRGTGTLTFLTRGTTFSTDELITSAVVANNTWYHVAFGVNVATRTKFLRLTDAAGTVVANISVGYSQASIGSDSGRASIGGETASAAGGEANASFGFAGNIDEVRVYESVLSAAQIDAVRQLGSSCGGTLRASYNFDETSYAGTVGEWRDSTASFHGRGVGASMPGTATASPARTGSPGTCRYASFAGPTANGPGLLATGLPTTTTAGAKTTVAFWMKWSGTDDNIVVSFGPYDLGFLGGHFGFNTNASDVYGIASTGLSGVWKHVVAVFVNGDITANELYVDGVRQRLTQRLGTPNSGNMVTSTSFQVSGYTADTNHRYIGDVDSVRLYNGAPSPSQVASLLAETPSTCVTGPARIRIEHASGSGLTCTPSTLTVRACASADCSSNYTSGAVTGTLNSTGGSVNWPDGASFSIAAGSSTATVRVQPTTTTATVLGVASSSPAASNAATCNFGSPVCTFTAADAGFVFNVPDHRSEASQTVNVSAVRRSDGSTICTPAFASTSKAVTFTCGYTNPATGTLPVRVGGAALNSGNNAAAACDSTGRAVTLAFNANGVASTTVQYADVGQLLLSARYAGAAGSSEAGLVMTGSDSFIAAPSTLTVSGVTSGPIRAGSAFAATATARNSAGNATPNFGRETSAETLYVGWTRIQPTGSGAINGSFSGSFGSFSGGSASASNLTWTEVGRGDLVLRSFNAAGYLGSGLLAYGSSAGQAVVCSNENVNCVLPGGTTATVYYGERSTWAAKTGQTGTVSCTNGNFGDPLPGVPKKCVYVATSATNGSVGDVIPHRFTVAASNACGSFSYAGQPMATTVTARNAAGNTTVNFNGTATTTPAFAQAVTLADAAGLGTGTLSGHTIAASGFSAGVASATPSYAFTSKTTAPQSLVLRATNGGSGSSLISSQGHAEPTLPLRSGRLRLGNAFGRATSALQMPVAVDHWSGSAWLLNSADSCTALAASSVVLSNPRGATGAASTATSSAGAVAISSGSGLLTLAAPSPAGSTLSLDIAVNLGSTGADQSCNSLRPASTGAGLPWLRAQNGSCAATADRDPAARASFGIFAPETRKTIHVRDLF